MTSNQLRSNTGFGGGRFGTVPFGGNEFIPTQFYDKLPKWFRDEDALNGFPFYNMIQVHQQVFVDLYRRICQMPNISNALECPSELLGYLASDYLIKQTDDEPEDARRLQILTLINLIQAKGIFAVYEIIVAAFGLSVTGTRLYQDVFGRIYEEDEIEEVFYAPFGHLPANHMDLNRNYSNRFQMWPYKLKRGYYIKDVTLRQAFALGGALNDYFFELPRLIPIYRIRIFREDGLEIENFETIAASIQERLNNVQQVGITLDVVFDGPKSVSYFSPFISAKQTVSYFSPFIATQKSVSYFSPRIQP